MCFEITAEVGQNTESGLCDDLTRGLCVTVTPVAAEAEVGPASSQEAHCRDRLPKLGGGVLPHSCPGARECSQAESLSLDKEGCSFKV